jgi:hypothetical protein
MGRQKENRMDFSKQLTALKRMTVRELLARYAEVFDEQPPRTNNRAWLIKRIAWRIQALAEGDLSERARRRAAELANDADLRLSPPKEQPPSIPAAPELHLRSDRRLPPPGSIIVKEYKGETLQVKVLTQGFEYEGEVYRSLSAVAKAISGSHCNGYLFFGLTRKGGAA